MSRTYKDKPAKVRLEPWDKDGYGYIWLPTTKTKKRKEVDTKDHWMSTPSAWTRLMMNRPQRRASHLWEKKSTN